MTGNHDFNAGEVSRTADAIWQKLLKHFERDELDAAVPLVRALPNRDSFPSDFSDCERAARFNAWLAEVRIYSVLQDGLQSGDPQTLAGLWKRIDQVLDHELSWVDLSHSTGDKKEVSVASIIAGLAFFSLREELAAIRDLQLRARINNVVSTLVEFSANIGRLESVSPGARAARARRTSGARDKLSEIAENRRLKIRDAVHKYLREQPASSSGRIAFLVAKEFPDLYTNREGKKLSPKTAKNDVAALREEWNSRNF